MVDFLLAEGVPPKQLILGMSTLRFALPPFQTSLFLGSLAGLPAYGRGFELSDPWMNGFLAPAKGPSMAFSVSQEPGAVFYFEVRGISYFFHLKPHHSAHSMQCVQLCDWMMKQEDNVTVVRDSNVVAPYVFNGRYWFSFDDPTSIMAKVRMNVG